MAEASQEIFSAVGELIKTVFQTLVSNLTSVIGNFPTALGPGSSRRSTRSTA